MPKHNIFVNREVSLRSFSAELVLKVRIQNPNTRENDFIEVELDRQELTYRSLLRVCCRELDISAEHVEKIRKLPNTMLRKVRSLHAVHKFLLWPGGGAVSQFCVRRGGPAVCHLK